MNNSSHLSDSSLDTIGETPLVILDRLTKDLPGRVLLKLEFFNPGHSIKDRIARQIIIDAEASGLLQPGQTVIELTSGNTGTGLALVCAVKGYRLVCVMSQGNSPERAQMMRAFGAEVILVPQVGNSRPGQVSGADLAEAERVASQLTQDLGAYRADQFYNMSNARAHELGTGAEILRQCSGRIDTFVSIAGTGGSFSGIARALKQNNDHIRCFLIEPKGAAFLSGHNITDPNHRIQGTGYAMGLPLLNAEDVDGYLQVADDEAIDAARTLARHEGILGGFSTGANVAIALRLAREAAPGQTIVTLACDSGMKYLSTGLYE